MIGTPHDWNTITEARLPSMELPRLARLRDRPDIRVQVAGSTVWLRFDSSSDDVLHALMPASDVVFYRTEHGQRYRFGQRLPTSDTPPSGMERLLSSVLLPAPFKPTEPTEQAFASLTIQLVRGGSVTPTTAMLCELSALRKLAETATTMELAGLRGLMAGQRAILFGTALPNLPGAMRLYGKWVLLPLGYCTKPMFAEPVLLQVCGAANDELVLMTHDGWERLPTNAEPLTRAGIRLALAGVSTS